MGVSPRQKSGRRNQVIVLTSSVTSTLLGRARIPRDVRIPCDLSSERPTAWNTGPEIPVTLLICLRDFVGGICSFRRRSQGRDREIFALDSPHSSVVVLVPESPQPKQSTYAGNPTESYCWPTESRDNSMALMFSFKNCKNLGQIEREVDRNEGKFCYSVDNAKKINFARLFKMALNGHFYSSSTESTSFSGPFPWLRSNNPARAASTWCWKTKTSDLRRIFQHDPLLYYFPYRKLL